MKINTNQIPSAGLILEEEFAPQELELETEIIKFRTPLRVKARVTRISNAVNVRLNLGASLRINCSRCLEEFDIDLNRDLELNYAVDNLAPIIELDQDIREELFLDYPLWPLCRADCKGLCAKCGNNLNAGECKCASV
ncbi:MAG: DUF177 domain-containing protein [Candidatus Omnitrophica bacterium]|nr:DUF177 domain-containing protein [Candidatus Omnitrophota bacterium]